MFVLLLAAVVGWVLLRGGEDNGETPAVLTSSAKQVRTLAGNARDDTTVRALRQTGRDAETTKRSLQAAETTILAERPSPLRTAGLTQVRAELQYAKAVSLLSGLADSDLLKPEVPAWQRIKSRIGDAAGAIRSGNAAIRKQQQAPADAVIIPAVLQQTTARMDATVAGGARTLARWRKVRAAERAGRRKARAKLASLQQYESAVEQQLGIYSRGRNDTDTWAAQADTLTAVESALQLRGFHENRTGVQSALSAITPIDAQTGEAQRQMLAAVSTSMRGLDAADQAVATAEFDSMLVTEQPTWPAFQEASQSADGQINAATTSWRDHVAFVKRGLKKRSTRRLTPQPRV